MRNSITTLTIIFVAMLSMSSFAQQLDQKEMYQASKKIAYQITEKMNLDEDQFVYLTRAVLSYEMTIQKVALSEKSGSNVATANEYTTTAKQQLESYVTDMFEAGKATKILAELKEHLKSYN